MGVSAAGDSTYQYTVTMSQAGCLVRKTYPPKCKKCIENIETGKVALEGNVWCYWKGARVAHFRHKTYAENHSLQILP